MMELEITIEHNIKELVRMNETPHQMHQQLRPDVFVEYNKASFIHWFQDFFDQKKGFSIFAKKGEKYLGYILVNHKKIPADSPFHQPNLQSYHIDQMAVVTDHQSKGIGRAMMVFLKNKAVQDGVNTVQLHVYSENKPAKEFYLKNGFMTTKEIMEIVVDKEEV